ncbi:hypothetical protein AB5I41_31320 [Sphingomonas sp. MMS24-JH45]
MEQPDGHPVRQHRSGLRTSRYTGDWLGAYDTYAEAADARRAALVEAAYSAAITTPEADSSLAPWTLDPEAAAILAILTANPICQTRHFETYVEPARSGPATSSSRR